MDGLWSSPDLVGLISMAVANREALALSKGWWRTPAKFARAIGHRRNRNTKDGSRRNITAHYDLGNDFYAEWLDPSMTYSAAVFDGGYDLEAAQLRKYARMLDALQASPGDHILEIGCGWGGFAEYAARRGMRVLSMQCASWAGSICSSIVRA